MSSGDDTFINITNNDIYKKLLDIEKAQAYTNGKVRLNATNIKGLWATLTIVVSVIVAILLR